MQRLKKNEIYGLFSTIANGGIIEKLKENEIKLFPQLSTQILESKETHAFLRNDLGNFDWIIFPDVFAVDYFLKLLKKSQTDDFEIDELKILVFGEAVADRLRFSWVHTDIVPARNESKIIISLLREYLDDKKLSETKFLLPKCSDYHYKLVGDLSKIGAEVCELEIYERIVPKNRESVKLKSLILGGAIDNFIFNAPEDVVFADWFVFPKKFSEAFSEINCFAVNEITLQTLRENGLPGKHFLTN